MNYLYKLVTTENVEINYNAFNKKEAIECLATMRDVYFRLQQENTNLRIEISAREEECRKLENALKAKYYCKYANKCDEFEDCSLEEYKDMAERNMVLSNNWDDLKEFLETNWKETQDIWFVKIINKMKEIEKEGVSDVED